MLYKRVSTLLGVCLSSFSFSAVAIDESVNWQTCTEFPDGPFQCATFSVPLDHQKQTDQGAMVNLALARLPASDQENKIGTLFLNPGGPGGSGVGFVFGVGPILLTEEVRSKYDLVGFDPRGIARSDELTCFEDFSELEPLSSVGIFPNSIEEVDAHESVDRYISDLCLLRASDLIDHMSTADVARDLDLLRQAVGDEKLNFAGYSYGSYLGVTYANLFPKKVGAMVVDGVLDPIAWSTGRGWQSHFMPFSTRVRSDKGTQDTLNEFFRICDEAGVEQCAFAGNSAERFDAIAESVKTTPISVTFPNGFVMDVGYQDLLGFTSGAMYNTAAWPDLASIYAQMEIDAAPEVIGQHFSAMRHSLGYNDGAPPVPQPRIGLSAVACLDSDNPLFYDNWFWSGKIADARFGKFGSYWTWISSLCHSWPGDKSSRYAGKFNAYTANPVLVVNTLFDPATPLRGAKIVDRILPNSRLLKVNGWGHTSLFLSSCADAAVENYLINGVLPEKGASCDQDVTPFGASPPELKSPLRRTLRSNNIDAIRKLREQRRAAMREILPKNK